jgi:hypothetical protein
MNDSSTGNLHELTATLAYEYWERRSHPVGSPEIDWSAAERALALPHGEEKKEFSLYSLCLEPDEKPYRWRSI